MILIILRHPGHNWFSGGWINGQVLVSIFKNMLKLLKQKR